MTAFERFLRSWVLTIIVVGLVSGWTGSAGADDNGSTEIEYLVAWMPGFSAKVAQAKGDPDVGNIHPHVVPIWRDWSDGR